jgi:glyoxylase-like metal-dependent hydrolase (beta-lactamase superfamily II)
MPYRSCLAAGSLFLLIACAAPPLEQQIITEATAALGGAERLQALRTLVQEGEGIHYYLGQDVRPHASGQTFRVLDYRRVVEFGNRRARTELTRTPNFLYFQGQHPQKQVQGLDGDIAYNVGGSGNASRVSDTVARERQLEFYHHPVALLQAALAPDATVADGRQDGEQRAVRVTLARDDQFDLAIDSEGLPVRIASRIAHPNLGDVVLSTHFADYRDINGIKLPARITTKIDDFTTAELTMLAQRVDEDGLDVAAPETVRSSQPGRTPQPVVVAEDVAPGVWRMAGQSHHSALIEFEDYLLLIDAPQSEARALAVIAHARKMRPNKPLTTLVTTHHHFDHTAGVRAAIAEGLRVVTHQDNRAFFEEIAHRPHTIVPDHLAKNPRELRLTPVGDEMTIEDASRKLVLYHVPGHQHSETMLVAYLPNERVLIEVDTFIPNTPSNPYIVGSARTMVEQVKKRNLQVDRIVPLHFTIEPYELLVKATGDAK